MSRERVEATAAAVALALALAFASASPVAGAQALCPKSQIRLVNSMREIASRTTPI